MTICLSLPGSIRVRENVAETQFMPIRLCYSYSTSSPEKTSLYLIKHALKELLIIDSILLDKISVIFGINYILRERFRHETDAELNLLKVQEEISKAKQLNHWDLPISE